MLIRKNAKNTKISSKQVFLIMTGFICNNNCVMCSVKPKGLYYKPRRTEEIIMDMKKGRELQYERIEFTGGEPTLRKDLPLLISEAKKLGYQEIAISTNARMLSQNKYLEKLVNSGLNRVTTTLYGPNKKIHETITRTPQSFDQTIKGIKNMIKINIPITINTVVFSLTAPFLKETGLLINDLGVKFWTLLDLIPDGYAFDNYKMLVLSPFKLKKTFLSIEPILNKFSVINILDFPFCLLPPSFYKYSNVNILAAEGRTQIIQQVGYHPKRFFKTKNVYQDIHKILLPTCKKCIYYTECGGLWKSYLQIFNKTSFRPIKK
ncbi:MAG: radical SAM protein [Minisyncoccia bacterium]